MKNLIERIQKLNKRGKILLGIVVIFVLILAIGGVMAQVAPEQFTELTGGIFGTSVSNIIHFYPDPICVPLHRSVPIFVKGKELGDPTRSFWSSDGSKVSTSNIDISGADTLGLGKLRMVTGEQAGASATVYIGGKAHLVADGSAKVSVRNSYADCWKEVYMPLLGLMSPSTFFATPAPNPSTLRGSSNESATDFTFVFVSDPQGPDKAVDADTVTNHAFNEAFADYIKDTERPAFIVVGGDFANLGDSSYRWIDDVLGRWSEADIAAYPIYGVVGNHDLTRNGTIPVAELGNYRGSAQDNWQNSVWQDHYFRRGGNVWPQNAGTDYRNLVYSFRYGNSMFIITDDFYMWGDLAQDLDVATYTLGNMVYGGVDPRQLAFIDNESQWAQENGLSHAFVFGHTHLFGSADQIGHRSPAWEESEPLRRELQRMMMSQSVFGGYFDGHNGDLSVTKYDPPSVFGTAIRDLNNSIYQASAQQANGKELDERGRNTYLSVHVSGDHFTITPVSWIHGDNSWVIGDPLLDWASIAVGEEITLQLDASSACSWSSSDPAVVSITTPDADSSLLPAVTVQGNAVGQATITGTGVDCGFPGSAGTTPISRSTVVIVNP